MNAARHARRGATRSAAQHSAAQHVQAAHARQKHSARTCTCVVHSRAVLSRVARHVLGPRVVRPLLCGTAVPAVSPGGCPAWGFLWEHLAPLWSCSPLGCAAAVVAAFAALVPLGRTDGRARFSRGTSTSRRCSSRCLGRTVLNVNGILADFPSDGFALKISHISTFEWYRIPRSIVVFVALLCVCLSPDLDSWFDSGYMFIRQSRCSSDISRHFPREMDLVFLRSILCLVVWFDSRCMSIRRSG